MILLLAACGSTPAPQAAFDTDTPPIEDARLVVGSGDAAIVVHAEGAWVGPEGDGSGVVVTATVPGPPPLTVDGDRSSWKLKEGVVTFEGNVHAVRGDVTIDSDTLVVRYSGDRIETAHAEGHVVVTRGERRATADRADLTVADGRVALDGNPRLTEGPNAMTGAQIVLYLDDERLDCEKCHLEVDGSATTPGPR